MKNRSGKLLWGAGMLLLAQGCSNSDPAIRFSTSAATAPEASGVHTVFLTIDPASAANFEIIPEVGGTATLGTDYQLPSRVIRVGAGATSASFDIVLLNDGVTDPNETVVLSLQPPGGIEVREPSTFTLTILDGAGPQVSFASGASGASEGGAATSITVQINPPWPADVSVPYTLSGTTASGADYTITPASPLVIPANAASAVLTYTPVDDALVEGPETTIITLGAPSNGASLGGTLQHNVILTDNDSTAPVVNFASAATSSGENAGAVQVTVQLSQAAANDVSVPYTVTGTATSPDDFTAAASPLVIPAGNTSGTITVTVVDDAADEGDETVILTLGAPTGGAVLGTPSQHTVTVTDNDDPAGTSTVRFANPAGNAAEDAGTVAVVVEISPTSANDTVIPFTLGGTAGAGADYAAPTSPLTIPANATSGTISVVLNDDAGSEADETIVITLQAPTGGNAQLGVPSTHTLTIEDDESDPPAQGTLFAFTDEYRLLRFDAGSPGTTTALDVTGVEGTRPDTSLPIPLAIDFRPATGELYLYTDDRRFYVIDTATGAATLRGTIPVLQAANPNLMGMDFEPCSDTIRVTGELAPGQVDRNRRFNPDGTLLANDTNLAYAAGDANENQTPNVSAIAYGGCRVEGTRLFGIDTALDVLVRIGTENVPDSPNGGQLRTVGALSTTVGGSSQVPFDIDAATGMGYTADTDGVDTILYRVNLLNGALTNLGTIEDAGRDTRVVGLSVQP